MSPAPNKITAVGNGTREVKEPLTRATPLPSSKTIRKRSVAKLLRLGGVVGNKSLLNTMPLGSVSVIRKKIGSNEPTDDPSRGTRTVYESNEGLFTILIKFSLPGIAVPRTPTKGPRLTVNAVIALLYRPVLGLALHRESHH
mgnify:CR=1 FL=1